jgi:hypothetical protein
MMSMYTPIPKAPPMRDHLRPILSTRNRRKKPQEITLTRPKKPLKR